MLPTIQSSDALWLLNQVQWLVPRVQASLLWKASSVLGAEKEVLCGVIALWISAAAQFMQDIHATRGNQGYA